MADVTSAALGIAKLLAEEGENLAQVEGKIRELQDELEWMHCFLRDIDASQLGNSMARKWVAQIRELAYEAEDVVEKFVVISRGGGHDLLSKIRKYLRMFLRVVDVHFIGKDIEALKQKISFLTAKLRTYRIEIRSGDSSSSWLLKTENETYFKAKDETLVGRTDDMRKLLDDLKPEKLINIVGSSHPSFSTTNLLSSGTGVISSISKSVEGDIENKEAHREIKVVSINGMSGIGKTFIAKKLFHDAEIRRHYEAFAWVSISKPCQMSAVQQELLRCLTSISREQIAQMTDDELEHQLRHAQRRKKCFIVLDGFWKGKLWDQLKDAFPRACNKTTILITTRDKDVATYVHRDAVVHELKLLDDNDSMTLLKERVGDGLKTEHDTLTTKMLRKCKGHPLAIAVLGGVLKKKKTPVDWEALEKNFNSYTGDDKDEKQPWKQILNLSFYDLPYQLKPCFIYLGYFPTNLELTTTKLSRLWEAEGLVSSGGNEESEETLEDVAEKFLAELVERSLVDVASRDLRGRAKTCRLHEIVQNLCMDKAFKVNWLSVLLVGMKTDDSSNDSKKSSRLKRRKSRRLAIYCDEELDKLPSDYQQASYVRSLLFFNTLKKNDFLIPLKTKALKNTLARYKLIKVLDIENIGLSCLPKSIGSLIHLTYLSLRGSRVSEIPSSVKHLKFLRTLDLRVMSFVLLRIPNVLGNLKQLAHLYLPTNPLIPRNKLQLTDLGNLETISNFNGKLCEADDLSTLKNLRQFSCYDYLSDWRSIMPLLPDSRQLIYLEYISLRLKGSIFDMKPWALSKCTALNKLWVDEKIQELITPNTLPQSLCKLTLKGSEFAEDPMPVLEKLDQLIELNLEHSSYEGTTMRCSRDGFKELRNLYLEGLGNLTEWIVEEDAMKKLVFLEINQCPKLKMLPDGLKFVKSLKELRIRYMPLSFFKGWTPVENRQNWDQNQKVKDVPHVYISKVLDLQTTVLIE